MIVYQICGIVATRLHQYLRTDTYKVVLAMLHVASIEDAVDWPDDQND